NNDCRAICLRRVRREYRERWLGHIEYDPGMPHVGAVFPFLLSPCFRTWRRAGVKRNNFILAPDVQGEQREEKGDGRTHSIWGTDSWRGKGACQGMRFSIRRGAGPGFLAEVSEVALGEEVNEDLVDGDSRIVDRDRDFKAPKFFAVFVGDGNG